MPTHQGEGAGRPLCWPVEGRGGQGPPLSNPLPRVSSSPPPVPALPLAVFLALRRETLLSQSYACEDSGVLTRSLKGVLLKVLHSPIPFCFVSKIKENIFFPTPSASAGVLLGTRKHRGQEPDLNSTREATPLTWTVDQESRGEDCGKAALWVWAL